MTTLICGLKSCFGLTNCMHYFLNFEYVFQFMLIHPIRLMEWSKTELPLICPATRAGRTSRVTPSTPPHATYNGLASATPSPNSAHPSMRALDQNEVEAFLNSPPTLVKKKFLHSPAQDVQSQGIWEIIGFTARIIDDEVDQELEVLFDEPGGPITMDLEEARDLLETSKLFI